MNSAKKIIMPDGEEIHISGADVDLSNTEPSATFVEQAIKWGIPDYSTGVEWSVTTGATFTAPYDCMVFHTEVLINGAESKYYINGNAQYSIWNRKDEGGWSSRTSIYPLKKGDIVNGFSTANTRINQFIYYKFSGQSN